jgi:hypothetical protein
MLEDLKQLEDDWDGEGAPKPSDAAIERTANVLRWAEERCLQVSDVDADVLGGVAVRLRTPEPGPLTVWVALMNNGRDTAVWSSEHHVVASSNVNTADCNDLDCMLEVVGCAAPLVNHETCTAGDA